MTGSDGSAIGWPDFLSFAQIHRLDRLCDEFERYWKLGEAPRIEDYLADLSSPVARAHLLADLIRLEVELLVLDGQGVPSSDEYRDRFPDDLAGLPSVLESSTGGLAPPVPATTGAGFPAVAWQEMRVFGRFSRVRKLGSGGMGVVYEVHDQEQGSRVALKVLPEAEPSLLYLFKREFRLLADLHHRNVVTFHELHSDGPRWFFTMELVEGSHFLDHVRAEPGVAVAASTRLRGATRRVGSSGAASPAPADDPGARRGCNEARLRDALRQLVEGVQFLHAAGFIHRDLKPSNVMVAEDGRVVILDLGLAMDRPGLQVWGEPAPAPPTATFFPLDEVPPDWTAQQAGTIAYMAPEQAAGDPPSPASDWYAVGVMLYEALIGSHPFGRTTREILRGRRRDADILGELAQAGVADDLAGLCGALLSRRPEERPAAAAIIARLSGRPAAAQPSPAPAVVLIGRDRHLEALYAALAAAASGPGTTMTIHGRSGVGKTSLIRRFVDDAAALGPAVILTGKCHEQETVPFKGLDHVVDSLSRYLNRLPSSRLAQLVPPDVDSLIRAFPVLGRVEILGLAAGGPIYEEPHERRHRAVAALRTMLIRIAAQTPLIVWIDDLQWGDQDTASILSDLVLREGLPKTLVLLSFREEDADSSACLGRLRELGGGRFAQLDLDVGPLNPEHALDLAVGLIQPENAASEARASSIARESEGHPYLITLLAGTGDWATTGGLGGATTLDQLLRAQIAALAAPAREILELVAVAGRSTRRKVLLRVVGVSREVDWAFALLRARRLVRGSADEPGSVEIYHDRIRDCLLHHLDPATLRKLHLGLAAALEGDGIVAADRLALHYERGGELGHAGRLYARAAADAAATYAFDLASRAYRKALDLLDASGDDPVPLRLGLGNALAEAGRGGEAAEQYLVAAGELAPDESRRLQIRAFRQYMSCARYDDATALLGLLLPSLGIHWPKTARAALLRLIRTRLVLWWKLRTIPRRLAALAVPRPVRLDAALRVETLATLGSMLTMIDPVRGITYQGEHLLEALRLGDVEQVAYGLGSEAVTSSSPGFSAHDRSLRLIELARNLVADRDAPFLKAVLRAGDGLIGYLASDFRTGHAACVEAESLILDQPVGSSWERNIFNLYILWSLIELGRVDEIARRLPPLMADARERNDLLQELNLGTDIMTFSLLALDRPDEAERALEDRLTRWNRNEASFTNFHADLARIWIHLYRGDPRSAMQLATAFWSRFRRTPLYGLQSIRSVLIRTRGRCAVAAIAAGGDRSQLLAIARSSVALVDGDPSPCSKAHARSLSASITATVGNPTLATAELREALEAYESAGLSFHAAACRRRLGEWVGGQAGDHLIHQADDWMTTQGIVRPDSMVKVSLA